MVTRKSFLTTPYSAYHSAPPPQENADLTHVEKGSAGGEYLRRFWQPIVLTEQVKDVPLKVRMFGEDLALFRTTDGDYGLLELHCAHRGTSLEYGIPTDCGLRCCYHGWLFGVDGRILETPGDPPGSRLKDRLCHGAYPVKEYKGLIFGYFGPPEEIPEFPILDSYEYPDDVLVPYAITYPCNWLQVHENVMDPAHAVFLHTRVSYAQFEAEIWGQLPRMEFLESPAGMIYITTRRQGDKIWVRSNDIILPNLGQVGHIWEDGEQEKLFNRVGITRWTTPVDNESCKIIGWRHFHPDVNPRGIGKKEECGVEKVDFYGQTGFGETYEERQKIPGDYDAIVSQRRIALHGLEHLTYCDKGVAMLRRLLKREIAKVARGEKPYVSPVRSGHQLPTYCHDTVLTIPPAPGMDDGDLLEKVALDALGIIMNGPYQSDPDRTEIIRRLLRDYQKTAVMEPAE